MTIGGIVRSWRGMPNRLQHPALRTVRGGRRRQLAAPAAERATGGHGQSGGAAGVGERGASGGNGVVIDAAPAAPAGSGTGVRAQAATVARADRVSTGGHRRSRHPQTPPGDGAAEHRRQPAADRRHAAATAARAGPDLNHR